MNKLFAGFFLVILFALPFNGICSDTVIVDAKKQYEFAQTLFEEKEFSAAAHEFIRFYYLFPGHEKVPQARYQTGVSFFQAGMFEDSARHLEKIAANFSDSGFSPDAMFKLSEVYLNLKNPARAATVLRNLVTLTNNSQVRDRACFMLGWLLLDKAEVFISSSDYKVYPVKEAEKYFSMISLEGQNKYKVGETLTSLKKFREIKKKSPSIAGVLSIIPGTGFLYCDRYQDALVSFLLNSTLMLAAYKSFENDNNFLGAAISLVEAGFYGGNIYGSVASAHKYNKKKQKDFINNMQQKYLENQEKTSFHTGFINSGLAFVFNYNF